jgi:hypothetical protein
VKKLMLKIEELVVESLEVAAAADRQGTVRAHGEWTEVCSTGIDYCTDNAMDCGVSFPYDCIPADTRTCN